MRIAASIMIMKFKKVEKILKNFVLEISTQIYSRKNVLKKHSTLLNGKDNGLNEEF